MSGTAPGRRGLSGRLGDLRVGTKVLAAVLSASAVGAVVTGVAVVGVRGLADSADRLYTQGVVPVAVLGELAVAQDDSRRETLNVLISVDDASREDNRGDVAGASERFDDALGRYRALPQDGGRAEHVETLTAAWAQYTQARDTTLLPLALQSDLRGFQAAQETVSAFVETVEDEVAALTEIEDASAQALREEAAGDADRAVTVTLAVLLAGLVLAIGLGTVVARTIVGPLRSVSDVLRALAEGDLTRTADVSSRDEVGQMATALNTALHSVRTAVQAMSRSARALDVASSQLSETSTGIAASAEQASAQSGVVAAAAEEVSRNVQTVATGADEMGASISEIAQNASQAARVAADAVQVAAHTNVTVSKLGESSTEIGNVVKVITSIAQQTNLLALNATIEAARAGEAGKGFAVVANEVKELAQETAKATEDISRRIQAIQSDTVGAVEAIGQISAVIDQINDYQTTIASAVEEQTATTQEMTRSVSEAAAGSTQIAQNIVGVAQAAGTTTDGVAQSQRAASELAEMSTELSALVGRFRA